MDGLRTQLLGGMGRVESCRSANDAESYARGRDGSTCHIGPLGGTLDNHDSDAVNDGPGNRAAFIRRLYSGPMTA